MDFLRIGAPLLRSTQPLLPFLAPSTQRTANLPLASTSRPFRRKTTHQHPPSRSFTSSRSLHASDGQNAPPPSSKPSATEDFSRLLDAALDGTKGVPTAPTGRTTRHAASSAQTQNSQSRTLAARQQERYNDSAATGSRTMEKGAFQELFEEVARESHLRPGAQPARRAAVSSGTGVATTAPARTMPGGNSPSPHSFQTGSNSDFFDISQMLDPLSNTTSLFPPTSTTTSPSSPPAPQVAPMKLNASVGRTIPVDKPGFGGLNKTDVGRAFKLLEITCARNSVRRDFMRQRFHERPGLKRKRLKSERWRRRFKEAFRGTIGMVTRMKNQGW